MKIIKGILVMLTLNLCVFGAACGGGEPMSDRETEPSTYVRITPEALAV